MSLKIITQPVTEPITLEEAKAHLRVTHAEEDACISTLIIIAREICEAKTLQALAPQTWRVTLDRFPSAIELVMTPVTSILSIKYRDYNNDIQTLSPSSYRLDNSNDFTSAWALPADGYTWPTTYDSINAVELDYVAGYTAAPASYKQWMLLTIGHFYRNRESASELNLQPLTYIDSLLTKRKLWYA